MNFCTVFSNSTPYNIKRSAAVIGVCKQPSITLLESISLLYVGAAATEETTDARASGIMTNRYARQSRPRPPQTRILPSPQPQGDYRQGSVSAVRPSCLLIRDLNIMYRDCIKWLRMSEFHRPAFEFRAISRSSGANRSFIGDRIPQIPWVASLRKYFQPFLAKSCTYTYGTKF